MCEKKVNYRFNFRIYNFFPKKIIQKIIQALKYNQNVCYEIGKIYKREKKQ